MPRRIPESEWQWYGSPGHFVSRDNCHFFLCTRVGGVMVSSVGDYLPTGSPAGGSYAEIGPGRLYETLVFTVAPDLCICGCGMPLPGDELYSWTTNTRAQANGNHRTLCAYYAEHQPKRT